MAQSHETQETRGAKISDAASESEGPPNPKTSTLDLVELRWLCLPGAQTLQYREADGEWKSVPFIDAMSEYTK